MEFDAGNPDIAVANLDREDVIPPPGNQPPYSPAGDMDNDACTVMGVAP